jgi:phage baseplate assembly protein W|tara:strand:+ start:1010 stop:1426 length:417 start_codon:yes stop_codon:yes gene_type:complete
MSVIEKDLDEDVYIGLKLPLDHSRNGFFDRTKTSVEQSKYNIRNLLLTKKGERLGNPQFGSDLINVLFEQEDDVESKVEESIRSSVSQFLPFVNIVKLDINFSETNKSLVGIELHFSLNTDLSNVEKLTIDTKSYSNN